MSDAVHELNTLWHARFPIARAMDLRAVLYDEFTLSTVAPLVGNTNIHDTAFAGSLYAMQAMTCWGLLHLALADAGLDGSIIQADGEIKFHRTITSDIEALSICRELPEHFVELRERGKVRMTLTASTRGQSDNDSACEFSGTYVVRLNR